MAFVDGAEAVMSPETRTLPSVLSPAEIEQFRSRGFVCLESAFSPELAVAMQDVIWDELLEDHAIERGDRSTWRQPPHSPRRAKHHPLSEQLAGERFQGAVSQLLGHDGWERPGNWGGFVVPFPEETEQANDVPADTWHWDGSPTAEGLLIFSYFSSVRSGSGGTHVLAGSHRLIADFYASLSPEDLAKPHKHHRKLFARCDPWLEVLNGKQHVEDRVAFLKDKESEVRGVPCQVVELTGEPGDAVFCNLGLLHATAPNRSDSPRFQRVKFLFLER